MTVIKKLRTNLGYTQLELVKKTGLSLRTIQRLESSNKEPKGHTLTLLSEVFNIEPYVLQNQFRGIQEVKESEADSIRLINLSILSFIGIPFGNIILPFILWRKNRQSRFVDEIGRRIVNFQIIFSVVLSILLCVSPFIGREFFSDKPIILFVLLLAYIINIVVVSITAVKLQRHNFNFLNLPLRFI